MTVEQVIRFTRPFSPKWRDDLERRYLENVRASAEATRGSYHERVLEQL
jgi:hypothetical protein